MRIDMRHWNGRSLHPFAVASDHLAGQDRLAASFLIATGQLDALAVLVRPGAHTLFGLPVYVRPEMSE